MLLNNRRPAALSKFIDDVMLYIWLSLSVGSSLISTQMNIINAWADWLLQLLLLLQNDVYNNDEESRKLLLYVVDIRDRRLYTQLQVGDKRSFHRNGPAI